MEIVLTPEAKRKDISGLAIRKLGDGIERIYGSAVGSLTTRFPKSSLLHLKPLLGKTEADETDLLLYLRAHPGVDIKSTDRGSLALSVDNEDYSVEELIAMNVQEIINRANGLLREKDPHDLDLVNKLAITVPDHFGQHQRRAMLDAGGLTQDDIRLVGDGVSVMMNFALKQSDFIPGEKYFYIVYDMGGGSTKATLFSVSQPANESDPLELEVGGYGYNEHLGGSKFTLDVASIIEGKFLETHKQVRTATLYSNPNAVAKIVQAAEKAKLILSANSEASVSIESLIDDIDFRTSITRQEFEDYIQDSSEDILKPIEDALELQMWETPVAAKDIRGIILTGGSSRVPIVQQKLGSLLGEEKVLKSVNADEAAVNGATVRAVKLFDAFKTKAVNIVERSSNEYALRAMGKKDVEVVFQRGSVYPETKVIQINGTIDTLEPFTIDLFENDRIIQTIAVSPSGSKKGFADESCSDPVVYNATLSLTQDRLLEVEKVEAVCVVQRSNSEEQDSKKNSKVSRTTRMDLAKKDIPLAHLSARDKLRLREHIKLLDEQDKERFEFEEAQNQLESLLYEVRGLLEAEDINEIGPKVYLDKLAEIVPSYLEWLEDDSDSAKKMDILSKINEISDLKAKVEIYVESASEALDMNQFEEMLERAEELVADLSDAKDKAHDGLVAINDTFAQAGYNASEEYMKISLPYYILNPLNGWEDKLKTLKGIAKSINEIVTSGSVDQTNREDLFELKLAFDEAYLEADQKLKLFQKARDYRFRELLSWFQRAEKAKKRREEKLRKSIEDRALNNVTYPESEYAKGASSISSSLTSSFAPTSTINERNEATSSERAIVHDEL